MKFRSILAIAALAVFSFTACEETENLGEAKVSVSPAEVTFDATGEKSEVVALTATRDWHIENKPDWVVVNPSTGKASTGDQAVTISVDPNKKTDTNAGFDREDDIIFTIGLAKASLHVKQAGEAGEYKVEQITCAEFIKTDGVTEYIISGNVTSVSTDYKYAYINDGTAEVEVYQPTNWSEYADKIKVGAKLTAQGVYTKYTNSSGKTFDELVGVILSVEEKTPQTEVTTVTCAEFIKTDGVTEYIISGNVTSVSTDYKYAYINDGTAEVEVYQPTNWSEYADKIKVGAKLTAQGVYTKYTNSSGKTFDELVGVILDVQEAETPDPTEMTLAEIVAAQDATPFIVKGDALVTAITAVGFVVTDGTAITYAYAGSSPEVKIGDKVVFSGTKVSYNGIPELKDIANIKVLSSGNSVSYPEAKDITSIFDTYTNTTMEYISFVGSLVKSGNYYNVTVVGATKMTGSIQAPDASLKAESFDGKVVKVTGYYIGISSSKYQNILAVAIEEDTDYKSFGVEKTEITVGAAATSATVNVTGNVKWTATSENATVNPASGEGKGAITVSFDANTDTENAKTYTVVVSTTEEVATKSYTVTITQSKASAGGESVEINISFAELPVANFPSGSSAGIKDGTYTISGYEFVFHANDKFYWNTDGYFLIGKKDSYILLPAVSGKSLTSVAFKTGANASENVIIDIYNADGTSSLSVNSEKIKKGTDYSWTVAGQADTKYQIRVTNAYNAQFQSIVLKYE